MRYQRRGLSWILSVDCMLSTNQSFFKDNKFPYMAIVSINESCGTWQLLLTRFKGHMY